MTLVINIFSCLDSFLSLARGEAIRLHAVVYTTRSYCSVAEVVALSRRWLRHLFLQPRQHGYCLSETLRVLSHPLVLWEEETDLAGIFQYI